VVSTLSYPTFPPDSGVAAYLAATPGCKAAILAYNGKQAVRLGEKIWAIPLGLMLS
jgi:uncharacterized protein